MYPVSVVQPHVTVSYIRTLTVAQQCFMATYVAANNKPYVVLRWNIETFVSCRPSAAVQFGCTDRNDR